VSTQPLNAVHDRDLDELLAKLGIKSKLDAGRLKCVACGNMVTRENLGGLFYQNKEVRVICAEVGCIDVYQSRRES